MDGRVRFPHSLGIFYQAMTQYLGFENYGDEFKVMGLAGHAHNDTEPDVQALVRLVDNGAFELNLEYFVHHRERVAYRWDEGSPQTGQLYSERLAALLGPARNRNEPVLDRHKSIAYGTQQVYQKALVHLLTYLQRRPGQSGTTQSGTTQSPTTQSPTTQSRTDQTRLVIAGGCAMNSLANGVITRDTGFEEVYVQPAPGDAGGAFGAAAVVSARLGQPTQGLTMSHAYWGPQARESDISCALKSADGSLMAAGCTVEYIDDESALCLSTAQAIANGQVVGWFQGRMEWGPRALGNRSILADPRRADIRELLNVKVKLRERFRPFAPAVLAELASDWFERAVSVLFMGQVLPVRAEQRNRVPAIVHVDGTGRLQTVTADANPRFHALISAFASLTGVPILLNTSFNENEPIVCSSEEAIACFLRTRMDRLVIGNWVVQRHERPAEIRGQA